MDVIFTISVWALLGALIALGLRLADRDHAAAHPPADAAPAGELHLDDATRSEKVLVGAGAPRD